jgi:hypothetical protein
LFHGSGLDGVFAAAYLCPVQLVVREARLVEAAEQAQDVWVKVQFSEILAVFVDRAGFIPALGDSGVVLPGVEQLDMFGALPVDHFEGEVLVQLGDVAAVADGSWVRFGLASWVHGVDRLLGELVGELLMFRHHWVLGDWLPDGTLGSIACSPDRTGAYGRSSTLPEGTPQHQDVAIADTGILDFPPWLWVLNGKTCGKEFLTNDFTS